MASSPPRNLGTRSSDFWVFCVSPSPRVRLAMSQESDRGMRIAVPELGAARLWQSSEARAAAAKGGKRDAQKDKPLPTGGGRGGWLTPPVGAPEESGPGLLARRDCAIGNACRQALQS